MGWKFKKIRIRSALYPLLFTLFACAPSPRFYLPYDGRFTQSDLDRVLAENPLGPTENIKVLALGRGEGVSHHVVQIRDREVPHIHKNHDLTVVVLRGQGYLMLEERRIELKPGGLLFIPRSIVHYFVNTHTDPSVALAIFTPPFDGKDTVPVEKP